MPRPLGVGGAGQDGADRGAQFVADHGDPGALGPGCGLGFLTAQFGLGAGVVGELAGLLGRQPGADDVEHHQADGDHHGRDQRSGRRVDVHQRQDQQIESIGQAAGGEGDAAAAANGDQVGHGRGDDDHRQGRAVAVDALPHQRRQGAEDDGRGREGDQGGAGGLEGGVDGALQQLRAGEMIEALGDGVESGPAPGPGPAEGQLQAGRDTNGGHQPDGHMLSSGGDNSCQAESVSGVDGRNVGFHRHARTVGRSFLRLSERTPVGLLVNDPKQGFLAIGDFRPRSRSSPSWRCSRPHGPRDEGGRVLPSSAVGRRRRRPDAGRRG